MIEWKKKVAVFNMLYQQTVKHAGLDKSEL